MPLARKNQEPDELVSELSPLLSSFSPQMSFGTSTANQPSVSSSLHTPSIRPYSENIYNAIQAASKSPPSPSLLQRMFEAAVSPGLPSISITPLGASPQAHSNAFMPGGFPSPTSAGAAAHAFPLMSPPPTLLQTSPTFPTIGLLSPRLASTSSYGRELGDSWDYTRASPGCRVAKVPLKPSPKLQSKPGRRFPPPMHLPCQIVDPQTNRLGPSDSTPDSCGSNNKVPLHPNNVPGPWLGDFAMHRQAFLRDYAVIDWSNVTVIELKRLLRKYGLVRSGKKTDLEDRVKQVARYLREHFDQNGVERRRVYEQDIVCDTSEFLKSP